jgi:hypothetical protein
MLEQPDAVNRELRALTESLVCRVAKISS